MFFSGHPDIFYVNLVILKNVNNHMPFGIYVPVMQKDSFFCRLPIWYMYKITSDVNDE